MALGEMGHEVRVFSGDRRAGSRALSVREAVADGIAVTSINTEPYLAFDDRRSYDNPAVDELVKRWVNDWRPDVVHAHSLQGLGAGWIDDVAASRPVVVTMHDWWWICARQFLVREDLSICGPLVDAGGCPCSGGVPFNQERRAWLAERLGNVSAVLTVSASQRESLLVNGFNPDRVRVVANGVDTLPAEAGDASAGESASSCPRLGFVGGWHDFKGLPLLLEARRRLPDEPLPFTLRCWGASESPESANPPPGVEVLPAYDPSESSTVMRGLDALAVPSLMRESFSLVAREAMRCGVPVICSDSGGPEEVVRDGENGLVVEAGNAAAWARALATWATDDALRRRLRAGAAATAGEIRTVATQAAELAAIYQEAVSMPSSASLPLLAGRSTVSPPDLVVVAAIEGAPLRYRGHHLVRAHQNLGGRALLFDHRDPRALDAIQAQSLVVLYRVPWSDLAARIVAAARKVGATIVFSVDDLIFDPSLRERIPALRTLSPGDAEHWMADVARYQATAQACGVLVGSTPLLVESAERQGLRAFLHHNYLGHETAHLSEASLWATREQREARRREGTVELAYMSGTTSHDADWAMVEPDIAWLLDKHPGLRLSLVGPISVGAELAGHPRVRRIPLRPIQELPALHTAADVVIAPLEPGLEFSEAKSAVKWIEAAATGVPLAASPTQPFSEVIDDGVTGVLVEPGQWRAAIEALVVDPARRDRVGRAARRAVYAERGPWTEARAWAELWPRLVEAAAETTDRALPAVGETLRATPSAVEPDESLYLVSIPAEPETVTRRLGGTFELRTTLATPYTGLCRIDLRTTTYGAPSPADLELELSAAGGEVLRRAVISPDGLADDGWTAWDFDPLGEVGTTLELRARQPGAAEGRGVGCWRALDRLSGDDQGLVVRAWAKPRREEVIAHALGRPLDLVAPKPSRTRRLRVLWHRGRHSLAANGLAPTAARVLRFGSRQLRGFTRRRRRGA